MALTTLLLSAFVLLVLASPFRVPFEVNEGWNALHADALLAGSSLYPPAADALVVNNYPPLSFFAVAAVSYLTGDTLIAGRLLALAGLASTGLFLALSARRLGASKRQAVFTGLVFPAAIIAFTSYAGIDDPQLLGHAFGASGLYLLLRKPDAPANQIGAALLLVLSGFIKHNLVVLPAALGLWLLIEHRRGATPFLVSGIAFALAGLALFRIGFGFDLLPHLMSARNYSFADSFYGLLRWLQHGAAPISLLGLATGFRGRDARSRLCLIYLGLALVIGTIARGGEGVDINAYFDADMALALSAMLLLSRWKNITGQVAAVGVFLIPVAIGVVLKDADARMRYQPRLLAAEERITDRDIALLKQSNTALCEDMALCHWADRQGLDRFNIRQQIIAGDRPPASLAALFATGRYERLQFAGPQPFDDQGIRAALALNYRIERQDGRGVFFRLRRAGTLVP